ncbi:MAG: hypothetical protein GXY48_07645 [Methanomicrobiales archaeon]|nr:hypothetical protein [Methanomicrobiales archaeon]
MKKSKKKVRITGLSDLLYFPTIMSQKGSDAMKGQMVIQKDQYIIPHDIAILSHFGIRIV